MKKLITAVLMLSAAVASAQNCEVSVKNLKGSYAGECKDGKAEGAGKATGADSYEGNFTNGYPDGQGTYRYANGNFYSGTFKKGMMNGNGEFHYVFSDGTDSSVVKGEWKNDKYKKSDPYKILVKTSGITRVQVKQNKGDADGKVIVLTKALAKSPSLGAIQSDKDPSNGSPGRGARDPGYDLNNAKFLIPVYEVTSYSVSEGNYVNVFKRATDKSATTEFQKASFPFRAIVNIGNQNIEFLITEPGDWTVELTIAVE